MNEEHSLPLWVRRGLIGVGLFLAGAILAFGYSYRPLHGALSWQVDQLEARLDERNRENVQLRDAIAKQQSMDSTRIDPATLAQVKKELAQTKRVLDQAEKDLKRTERKRKDTVASAATWRKRFETLRDTTTSVATISPARVGGSDSAAPTAPAAPANPSPRPGGAATSERSQPSSERGILLPSETSGPTTR